MTGEAGSVLVRRRGEPLPRRLPADAERLADLGPGPTGVARAADEVSLKLVERPSEPCGLAQRIQRRGLPVSDQTQPLTVAGQPYAATSLHGYLPVKES